MLWRIRVVLLTGLLLSVPAVQSQSGVDVRIEADKITAHIGPAFYGIMTEDINHAYDGGLYAELVRNRNFKENLKSPAYWKIVEENGASGSMSLDPSTPFNQAVPATLKLIIDKASAAGRVGVANEGFWGIATRPNTAYKATFYAKAAPGFTGPITLAIVGDDGISVRATAQVSGLSQEWKKFEATLTTGDIPVSANNQFVLMAAQPGTIWFGFVSLFPPTYRDRLNGNRPDIMRLLADMNPGFMRLPGGSYLTGTSLETRFDWKSTIGDISERPGHWNANWHYWSSDGLGLLEMLNWCEDLNLEPLLAVYAGRSGKTRFIAHSELQPFIQDALDEIEYVTGDVNSKWGARRAQDGHAAPFRLRYVEIGNEDNFDNEPGSYEARFPQFYDAIKARYPNLKVIATDKVNSRTADVIDEHYYKRSEDEMASHANDYELRLDRPAAFTHAPREILVGEWATRVGDLTPNWSATLGDAAWLVGLERNAHLVTMEAYAPLLTRVDSGTSAWPIDLIGFNSLESYSSPSAYMQGMFATYHGDEVLSITAKNVPSKEWQPFDAEGIGPLPARDMGSIPDNAGRIEPAPNFNRAPAGPLQQPAPQQIPFMFFDSTRDSKTGALFIKIVNRSSAPQAVHFALSGVASVASVGQTITLSGQSPADTNSIAEPKKIVPTIAKVSGFSSSFTRSFTPYSVTILELKTMK
jgi:alpha-N-arabinofuranosidase